MLLCFIWCRAISGPHVEGKEGCPHLIAPFGPARLLTLYVVNYGNLAVLIVLVPDAAWLLLCSVATLAARRKLVPRVLLDMRAR